MKTALVIGAGPAGLMAAEMLTSTGTHVIVCDAKTSFGRKFLMAGKSGLNLTKDEPLEQMLPHYAEASERLRPILAEFDAKAITSWAQGLGQEVFVGSTGRVFPKSMKASPLLRAWLARLDARGVERRTGWRWRGWDGQALLFQTPEGPKHMTADVVILALGGASWARLGSDGRWAETLRSQGAPISSFVPSNSALSVNWTDHMSPFFGAALKSVRWHAGDWSSRGEAIISRNGLEGGGIYTMTPAIRAGERLFVDLAPDQSLDALSSDLSRRPAKRRLAHWLKKGLRLPPAKVAFFFEMTARHQIDRGDWARLLKSVPVRHAGLRPMDEAISTAGGLSFDALTRDLMLKSRPGVFCAGEMIDWDAPTGGYLLTACLATGKWAGSAAARYLADAAR